MKTDDKRKRPVSATGTNSIADAVGQLKPTSSTSADAPRKRNRVLYLLSFVWLLIPLLMLLKIISDYQVNLPANDDYNAILEFLSRFKQAGASEKLQLLFSQHNEHRIVTSRIIYVLYYWLTGHVSFDGLRYIGNLQLVPVFLVGAYFIRKLIPTYWYIPAFIFSLCLFDISGYENSYSAMASMQNYGVVMWLMLSLFCYSRPSKRTTWLGAVCQLLCIFSSGNGMVGALLIMLFVLLNRNRFKSIMAITTFVVFAPLYFIHYHRPADSPGMTTVGKIIPFFLHEVGAHFGYTYGVYIGGLILLLLAVCLPLGKRLRIPPVALPLLTILAFALASLGTAAIFRAGGRDIDAYASRYFIYPGLIVAILFCFIMYKTAGWKIFWPVTVVCLLLLLNAYKDNYEYGLAGYQREQEKLTRQEFYFPSARTAEARSIADNACKLGIYCINEER